MQDSENVNARYKGFGCNPRSSLRGRRLKGKGKGVLGKGVLGARETRGAREEGGRETPARKPLFFSLLTSTRRMLKS